MAPKHTGIRGMVAINWLTKPLYYFTIRVVLWESRERWQKALMYKCSWCCTKMGRLVLQEGERGTEEEGILVQTLNLPALGQQLPCLCRPLPRLLPSQCHHQCHQLLPAHLRQGCRKYPPKGRSLTDSTEGGRFRWWVKGPRDSPAFKTPNSNFPTGNLTVGNKLFDFLVDTFSKWLEAYHTWMEKAS